MLVREILLPVPPAADELAVVPAGLNQRVRDREQDGGLGARVRRDPVIGVRGRVRQPRVEHDEGRPPLLGLDDALGVGIEVVSGLQVAAHEEHDLRVRMVGTRAVGPHPEVVAGASAAAADVRMGVVPVDAPGREDALGKSVLPGPANVVHHLVRTAVRDRGADARRDLPERLIPSHPLPFPLAPLAGAPQRVQNPVGIGDLVEGGRTLRAVPPARPRVLRVALEFSDLERLPVDVREQTARGLAVEARRGHEHVPLLDAARGPGLAVQLDPIIPPLFRRKRREVDAARARVERLAARFHIAPRGADPSV